jgi:hypothetical protein
MEVLGWNGCQAETLLKVSQNVTNLVKPFWKIVYFCIIKCIMPPNSCTSGSSPFWKMLLGYWGFLCEMFWHTFSRSHRVPSHWYDVVPIPLSFQARKPASATCGWPGWVWLATCAARRCGPQEEIEFHLMHPAYELNWGQTRTHFLSDCAARLELLQGRVHQVI